MVRHSYEVYISKKKLVMEAGKTNSWIVCSCLFCFHILFIYSYLWTTINHFGFLCDVLFIVTLDHALDSRENILQLFHNGDIICNSITHYFYFSSLVVVGNLSSPISYEESFCLVDEKARCHNFANVAFLCSWCCCCHRENKHVKSHRGRKMCFYYHATSIVFTRGSRWWLLDGSYDICRETSTTWLYTKHWTSTGLVYRSFVVIVDDYHARRRSAHGAANLRCKGVTRRSVGENSKVQKF